MRYRYIFFDLDGTIIDSSEGVINSIMYALKKYNLDNYSIEILRQTIIGPPLYEGLTNLLKINDDIIYDIIKDFREHYSNSGVFQNNLFNGIEEVLEKLYNSKINLEILTSKPQRFAKQILKQHNIIHYFSNVDGAGEFDKKTTKSKKLLSKTKNKEQFSIMIGDRVEDIEAGKKCGVDTIAVTYGYDDAKNLINSKPTFMANNAFEILEIINNSEWRVEN